MVVCSLLAILASLSVFLAPVAYFGLLQTASDLSHGQRSGLGGFWGAFKAHWAKALIWGLASLGVIGPLGAAFWISATKPSPFGLAGLVLSAFGVWLAFTLSQLSAACFFLQEPQELSLSLKNAWVLLRLHPDFFLGCGLINLLLTLLSLRFYLPIFLGVEAFSALFSILQVQRTLGKEPEPKPQ